MKNIHQIICLLLAMTTLFAAVSCARSTGPSENPADTTEAKETTAPEDTTISSPPVTDSTPFVKLMSQSEVSFDFGEDVVDLTVLETGKDFETNKAVVIGQIYDPINEEIIEKYLIWAYCSEYKNETNYIKDSTVYLYNARLGEIEASADMRDGISVKNSVLSEDGTVIISGYDRLADEEVFFAFTGNSGLELIDYHAELPRDAVIYEKTFVSPDGKTKVQNIYKESIKIIYPSGEEKTVLPRVDTDPYGMYATVYYACGFIDNERFVYSKIHGRLGIYNVNTHESVEYENSGGQNFVAFGEDGMYTWDYNEAGFHGRVGLLDRDEVFHIHTVPRVYSGVFDSGNIHFCSGKWVVFKDDELYIFSHDLKTVLATADLPENRALHYVIINENRISLFFTEEKDIETKKLESGIKRNDAGYSFSSQTYTELLGKTGNMPMISFMRDKNNMLIRIYEDLSGTPSYECNLMEITEDNLYSLPTNVSYTDDGFILYNYRYEDNEGICDTAFKFRKGEHGWSYEPTEFNIDGKVYACNEIARSPDGKYTVYKETRVHLIGDIDYSSRILVSYNGGEKEIVSELLPSNNDNESYEIVGFIDNENLIYNISKGGICYGYGIYNTVTKQKTENRELHLRAVSVYEGKIYLYLSVYHRFYITDLSSSATELSSLEKVYYKNVYFVDGRWILYSTQKNCVYVYNEDMTEILLMYDLYEYADQGFLLVGKDKVTVFGCNQPLDGDIF